MKPQQKEDMLENQRKLMRLKLYANMVGGLWGVIILESGAYNPAKEDKSTDPKDNGGQVK